MLVFGGLFENDPVSGNDAGGVLTFGPPTAASALEPSAESAAPIPEPEDLREVLRTRPEKMMQQTVQQLQLKTIMNKK